MSFASPMNSYRQSSIAGATPIGLVIALYDRLARDLREASDAIRRSDIEGRCAAVNHAFLVLGQLEDWLASDPDDPLVQSLTAFYQVIRARLLQACLSQSSDLVDAQIELVLQVRSAWQQRDSEVSTPSPSRMVDPMPAPASALPTLRVI